MAADTITFTRGPSSVTIPAPDYPHVDGGHLAQVAALATGGSIISQKRRSSLVRTPVLRYEALSETDYDDLLEFIYVTAKGSALPFTYNDRLDVDREARYLRGLPGELVGFNRWRFIMVLGVTG